MTEERDFEAEARADGWVPQTEWKGDPSSWVDAKTFISRGESIRPILQANYRKTKEELAELKRKFDERESVFDQFRTFQEQALEKANKERAQAIADLEAERRKAITEGDGEAFTRADQKLHDLRNQVPPPKREESRESPDVTAWKAENTWYTTDRELTAIADGLSDVVKAENPSLRGKAFLDKLTERVRSVVPHKFENPRRQEHLTDVGQRKGTQKGRTYENLPDDAKAACDRFVKTIPHYTVEKYLATYSWE